MARKKKMHRRWARVLAVNKASARKKARKRIGKHGVIKRVTLAQDEKKPYYVEYRTPARRRRRR